MRRVTRYFVLALFALIVVGSFFITGCTRYANEEQLTTLDESAAATSAAEQKIAELEKEKAELQQKLAEKQDELKKVQAEKDKVQSKI
jgi:peptidoglycan hydrolase CwlO-like protein